MLNAAPAGGTRPREHERAAPLDPALAEHVAHFWWVAWDVAQPVTAETLPHPTVHVVFEPRRAQIAGVPTGAFRKRLAGRGRAFGIKFRPAAFHAWLGGRAMSALTDRRVPLADVFAAGEAAAWSRAMRAATTFDACRTLAEAWLLPRLPVLPVDTARLRDLVERMASNEPSALPVGSAARSGKAGPFDATITRVDQVAAIAGLDARTLQRRFAQRVGVSPKWVVQRYRLHEAAALLARPDAPPLAAIAAQLGYYDQAHFAREFRAVVGAPPSRYLAARAARA